MLLLVAVLAVQAQHFFVETEQAFADDGVCGDGAWDFFTEECDGVAGCDNATCVCSEGYAPTADGGCVPSCMYGTGCLQGCISPDICTTCDPSRGYTPDCAGCLDGFLWFGSGRCRPFNVSATVSCGELHALLQSDADASFNYTTFLPATTPTTPQTFFTTPTTSSSTSSARWTSSRTRRTPTASSSRCSPRCRCTSL